MSENSLGTVEQLRCELERTEQITKLIDTLPASLASEQPKKQVFTITAQEGKAMTGCQKGNERAFLQWLCGGVYPLLEQRDEDIDGSKLWLLDSLRAVLLSAAPEGPLEAMLVTQMVATHEMAVVIGRRAVVAKDPEVCSKLTERYVRLVDMACRQAEAIQKLRGESGRQVVTVQHLNITEGGQAIVGQAIVRPPGGSPENAKRTP